MVASDSKRTFRKSFTVSADALKTDMEENLPVYLQDMVDIKKSDAKEMILDYSDGDVRNVTLKYGMTAAYHVITAYMMRDVPEHDYIRLLADIEELEKSEDYDKDFEGFSKKYSRKDFVIPGIVLDDLKSGDVETAKEKIEKYHQLAESADAYINPALKEIDPSKFVNKSVSKAMGFNKSQIYDTFRNAGCMVNLLDLSGIVTVRRDLDVGDYDAASKNMTEYLEKVMFAVEKKERDEVNIIYSGLNNDIENYAEEFSKRKKINKAINRRMKKLENNDDIEDAKQKKEENMSKIKNLRQEFEKKYGSREKNPFAPVIDAVYMGDADTAKEAYENIIVDQMKKVNDSIETLKKLDKSLYIGGGNKAREYAEKCDEAIEFIEKEFGSRMVRIHDQAELDREIDKCYYQLDNGSFVLTEDEVKVNLAILEEQNREKKEEKFSGYVAKNVMIKLINSDDIKELKESVDEAINKWETAEPEQRYEWQEYAKGLQYSEEFIGKLKSFREAYLQAPNDLEQLRTSRVPRQDMSDFVILSYLESKFDSEEADRFLDYYKSLEFLGNEDVKNVKIYYDTESVNGIGVNSVNMAFLNEDGKTVSEAVVPEEFNEIIDAYQIYYRLNNANLSI